MPYPSRIDAAGLGAVALAVIEEQGWSAWTLRHVADRIGVSPNALYRHTGDRDGLAVAAGAAAATELRAATGRAAAATDDPEQALRHAVLAYLRFARERPEAYSAFVRAKPDAGSAHLLAWSRLWASLRELAAAVVPVAPDATGFALWTLAHGHADLLSGPARLDDPEGALAVAIDALVVGMRAAGAVPSPVPKDLLDGL